MSRAKARVNMLIDKGTTLTELLRERKVDSSSVVYVGNDVNDLPCFDKVGWAVAVADAYPQVQRVADYLLAGRGGEEALRELCDLILVRSQTD